TRLIEKLFEALLIREAVPVDTHREFCMLPFKIVCTTKSGHRNLRASRPLLTQSRHPRRREPQTIVSSSFRCPDPAFEPSLHQHKSLPAGNAILRGRDKGPERAL